MREMLFENWKWLFENTNQTPPVFLTKNKKDKRFRFKFKKKRDFDFEGVVKSKAVKPNCLRRPYLLFMSWHSWGRNEEAQTKEM